MPTRPTRPSLQQLEERFGPAYDFNAPPRQREFPVVAAHIGDTGEVLGPGVDAFGPPLPGYRGFLVVIEQRADGFHAAVPDLPGVTAAAATRDRCEAELLAAVTAHVDALRAAGTPIPLAVSAPRYVVLPGF